jgi:hypothetical protein
MLVLPLVLLRLPAGGLPRAASLLSASASPRPLAERGWDAGCLPAKGSVRLGRQPGCLATIEAVLVPVVPGRLAVPRLSLRGVHGSKAAGGGGGDDAGAGLDAEFVHVLSI